MMESPYSPPAAETSGLPPAIVRARRKCKLWKTLQWLAWGIVMASPVVAIGGTVYGMLNAFATLKQAGNADPSVLAGHISVALLTTLWSFINMMPFIILGIVCTKRHRFWKQQLA